MKARAWDPIYMKLTRHPDAESRIAAGQSKCGGSPDLPANLKWPRCKTGNLPFLFQINLSELTAVGVPHPLPKRGMLWFFWSGEWGYHPDHKASWRVIFLSRPGKLVRRAPPKRRLRGDFPEPDLAAISFSKKEVKPELKGNNVYHPRGQLLGEHAMGYQFEDPRATCQLASNGINAGVSDAELEANPRVKKLLGPAFAQLDDDYRSRDFPFLGYSLWKTCSAASKRILGDWQYLLQYDDDVGAHFFLIHKKDLAKRNFEKVWFCYQTT